ncbi:hypothetical protein BSKO_07962 [Bryopsis sp. KO-2023]|nr:hypothetical protein BSKO_07962 [Bryopsis sp. KO-2023]
MSLFNNIIAALLFLTLTRVDSAYRREVLQAQESAAVDGEDCPGRGSLQEYADYFDKQLRTQTLLFWYDKLDVENGGFDLDPDGKHIVAQSRLIWLFSYTHLKGFNADGVDSLNAAAAGFEFVSSKMRDPVHGGYYWSVDKQGNVQDDRKMMYGQSFVLYAFTTYFKASGDPKGKELAMELFQTLVDKAQDTTTGLGGWFEQFTADWTVLSQGDTPLSQPGSKTHGATIHFMESLTDLLLVTGNPRVRAVLAQVVDKDIRLFFPPDPDEFVTRIDFSGNSIGRLDHYGYGFEYAWLRIEAQRALGRSLNWDDYDRYTRKMIEKGIDAKSGGIFDAESLVWWAQAEVMSGVAVDKAFRNGSEYEDVLLRLMRFVECAFVDPKDGIWRWGVNSDGSIQDDAKFNKWKAGFHDTRGMVKFVKAYKAVSK